jgi:hypothetical protein
MEREFLMGKRSNFKRRPMDAYQTIDPRAVQVLLPFIWHIGCFAEPCAGDGHLVRQLREAGKHCLSATDIKTGTDARSIDNFGMAQAIITNPPWSRDILHELIVHFRRYRETWLLLDSDWMHNVSSAPYLDSCSHIVSVGRLKWEEGSKHGGKDNCCWYRFWMHHRGGPHFYQRQGEWNEQCKTEGDAARRQPADQADADRPGRGIHHAARPEEGRRGQVQGVAEGQPHRPHGPDRDRAA